MTYITKKMVINTILERLQLLKKIAEMARAQLKNVPEGSLNVAQKGGKAQFYQYMADDSSKDLSGDISKWSDKKTRYRGKYIKKSEIQLAMNLAQKDYNCQVLREVEEEADILEKFLHRINTDSLDAINELYTDLIPARKALVTPLILSDEEYASKWKSVEYTGKSFSDTDPEHYTDLGERVRSKSEVMIANALTKAGIPYRYEYPINIRGFGTVYPDFYCLKIRTREEVAWEHMGLLDDEVYRKNALDKINRYEANGYVVGRNLIISHETPEHPLNKKIIEMKIGHFLM